MKPKIILFILFFGCVSLAIQAQSYKQNKLTYDHRNYVPQEDDRYNSTKAGFASLFVPGLGQIISGEAKRGLAFMGGAYSVFGFGYILYKQEMGSSSVDDVFYAIMTKLLGMGMMAGAIVINLWSVFDAIKVAKVNNMYYQKMRDKANFPQIKLQPFVNTDNYLGQLKTSAGLSLKVMF